MLRLGFGQKTIRQNRRHDGVLNELSPGIAGVPTQAVGRGVVLHLLPGGEVVLPGRRRRRVADPVAAAKGRQRRVGEHRAGRAELLVDAHEIPLAGRVELEDPLPMRRALLRARTATASTRSREPGGLHALQVVSALATLARTPVTASHVRGR